MSNRVTTELRVTGYGFSGYELGDAANFLLQNRYR
jgi:hypothetical protein